MPSRQAVPSRRSFLWQASACSLRLWSAPLLGAQSLRAGEQTSALHVGSPAIPLPDNFVGLGYEMSSAARPGLLSTANAAYRNLVRGLGAQGVLRFGGIVADYTRYEPEGTIRTDPKDTVITRASLLQLRAFLDATGWSAMWSLNFGRGTLAQALAEARDVAHVLGSRLLAFELGNEVENYGGGREPRRPAPYSYSIYRSEYTEWHTALLQAVPGSRFAAPDTAASVTWVEQMAADAHGDVQLLTTHYYRGDQHRGTQEQLLHPDPALEDEVRRLRQASATSRLPWRMCETNSFFGGGRPGLSDTLLAALWTLDYMLRLAAAGCAGVNLETGVNQLGFFSSYSPITDDGKGHNAAGVPYYGMLAFAQAARGATAVCAARLSQAPDTASAYVLFAGARPVSLVVINRSPADALRLAPGTLPFRHGRVLRLSGPGLASTTKVSLGGATVSADGTWKASSTERAADTVAVPAGSAAVLLATS